MRYMGFVIMDPEQGPPPQALMDAMGDYIAKSAADGVFIDGGGLGLGDAFAGFQVRSGKLTSTDGPFTEAREVIGGYAVLEVRDHAEAIQGARELAAVHLEHWPQWQGRVEVRRIDGPEDEPQG